jgi:hypothetical protein
MICPNAKKNTSNELEPTKFVGCGSKLKVYERTSEDGILQHSTASLQLPTALRTSNKAITLSKCFWQWLSGSLISSRADGPRHALSFRPV